MKIPKLSKYLCGLIFGLSLLSACATTTVEKANENTAPAKPAPTAAVKTENNATENKSAVEPKEELVEIFDGRKDLDSKEPSGSETEQVKAEFNSKKAVIKQKFGERYCDESEPEDIAVDAVAKGSFTKPNTDQTAVLYTVCSTGSSHFGVGGVIIFEGGKAVSHYVYGENGLDQNITTAPDFNKNGLTELLLIDGQTHQGYTTGVITIIEFGDGNAKFIGTAPTYDSNDGAMEDEKKALSTAYKISAAPAANPTFFRDVYEMKGTAKQWSLSKKAEKFNLDKIDAEFAAGFRKVSN